MSNPIERSFIVCDQTLNLNHPWGEVVITVLPNNRRILRLPVSCLFNSGSSNLMIKDSRISSRQVSRSKHRDDVHDTISSLVILRPCFSRKCFWIAPLCRWSDNLCDFVQVVRPVYRLFWMGRCSHSPFRQSKS